MLLRMKLNVSYLLLGAMFTLVISLASTSSLAHAKFKFPSNDFANAETKDRLYSFDFDFSLLYGEDGKNTVVRNKNPTQDTVSVGKGWLISGDFNSESTVRQINSVKAFLTKDKIKVTSDKVQFGKIYNLKDLQCFSKCSSFYGHVPNVKKASYSLVYIAKGDEIDKFYITTISVK